MFVCLMSCTHCVIGNFQDGCLKKKGGQWVHIKFCADLRQAATKNPGRIQQLFGMQSPGWTPIFMWHAQFGADEHQLMMMTVQGGPWLTHLLKMLQRSSSMSMKISVSDHSRALFFGGELIFGTCQRFSLKNWPWTALQPNLNPGSLQLIKCSNRLISAVRFINSPQRMWPF